jgi:catechol 2,3-dioxygenase-like lactoylglutathione lyase family enzyme
MSMIESLDHVVLTARDLDATVRFCVVGLGMQLVVALPWL